MKYQGIFSTWLVGQSFMKDSLTALMLLHLHQELSQVIAQEALLLSLQGCLIVIYSLCHSNVGLTRASLRGSCVIFKKQYDANLDVIMSLDQGFPDLAG